MTSKTFQILLKPKDVDQLISEEDEIKLKEQLEEIQRKRMEELMKDFELFIKAQMEKNRLERINKNKKQKIKDQQRLADVEQILQQTKRRLRLNPTTKAMKFDLQFKNYKNIETFLDVKNFLESMNTLAQKKESQFLRNNEEKQQQFSQNLKLPIIENNKQIQIAKKSINNYHSQIFQKFHNELDSLYNQQKNELIFEKDENPDSLFYSDIIESVNHNVKQFIIKQEQESIQAEKTTTFETTKLFIPYNQEQAFKDQATKVRQLMKNVSEDMFKKKWGNSMMKKHRELEQGKKSYDSQKLIRIKSELKNQHFKTENDEIVENKLQTQSYHKNIQKQNSVVIGRKKVVPKKICPPSLVQSLKSSNELILKICNKEYQQFQEEIPVLKESIKQFGQGVEFNMGLLAIKDEKYRKYL